VAADRPGGRRSDRARRALEALTGKDYNFDPDQAEHFTGENGWHVDDYAQPLPPEPPGPPASPTRSSGSASGCSAAGSSAASPGTPASAWPA
jgi:hypothetical protein